MFNNIPQQRLLLYIILAGFFPILIAWFVLSGDMEKTTLLENQVLHIQQQAFNRENKQAMNMAVRFHFSDADHFYIDKYLETMTFLEPEVESLKAMLNNPHFPQDEHIKKRLDMLTGSDNTMIFTEGVVQSTPFFQEVTETLVHPVEININDLKHILCKIEGISIGSCTPPSQRPQLIILDFKIHRKNVSEKNQVFQLNLKLLKREYL